MLTDRIICTLCMPLYAVIFWFLLVAAPSDAMAGTFLSQRAIDKGGVELCLLVTALICLTIGYLIGWLKHAQRRVRLSSHDDEGDFLAQHAEQFR
jgi:uncharacterized membrane-anchored protein